MKNKIETLFEKKDKNILSIYFTAGYPQLNDTVKTIKLLQENKADLIEIGIPYSDPLADGQTIQAANQIAIGNGMTLTLLFQQLKATKSEIKIPLILMGYLNIILQFGVESFYQECYLSGISTVIIPDMPVDEYLTHHQKHLIKYDIKVAFLITPTTSFERIKLLDEISTAFIYVVSSNSITGNSISNFTDLQNFYNCLKTIKLKNKTLIGFGINTGSKFKSACELANGGIIGSAFIKALENNQTIPDFINSILKLKTETI